MKNFNYKCIISKTGAKMYYKKVGGKNGKWKRISNKIGEKAEKGKRKYRVAGKSSSSKKDSEKCENSTDMFLTPFNEIPDEDIFIQQGESSGDSDPVYHCFARYELIEYVLGYNERLDALKQKPRQDKIVNPYNNVPFNQENLWKFLENDVLVQSIDTNGKRGRNKDGDWIIQYLGEKPSLQKWRDGTGIQEEMDEREKLLLQFYITELDQVAYAGRIDILRRIFDSSIPIDVNMMILNGTLLHHAARSTDPRIETMELLLDNGAEINKLSDNGKTALILAINRNYDNVEFLLERGADPNIGKPLHDVKDVRFARLLVSHGADPNSEMVRAGSILGGDRPLHTATVFNREDMVKYLLEEADVDINSRGVQDRTPLHIASWIGHLNLVRYLLKNDADINAMDNKGETPLYKVHHPIDRNNEREAIETLLVAHGGH